MTLEVTARKVVFDSAGVEADVPMDEWVPISVLVPPGGRRPGQPALRPDAPHSLWAADHHGHGAAAAVPGRH